MSTTQTQNLDSTSPNTGATDISPVTNANGTPPDTNAASPTLATGANDTIADAARNATPAVEPETPAAVATASTALQEPNSGDAGNAIDTPDNGNDSGTWSIVQPRKKKGLTIVLGSVPINGRRFNPYTQQNRSSSDTLLTTQGPSPDPFPPLPSRPSPNPTLSSNISTTSTLASPRDWDDISEGEANLRREQFQEEAQAMDDDDDFYADSPIEDQIRCPITGMDLDPEVVGTTNGSSVNTNGPPDQPQQTQPPSDEDQRQARRSRAGTDSTERPRYPFTFTRLPSSPAPAIPQPFLPLPELPSSQASSSFPAPSIPSPTQPGAMGAAPPPPDPSLTNTAIPSAPGSAAQLYVPGTVNLLPNDAPVPQGFNAGNVHMGQDPAQIAEWDTRVQEFGGILARQFGRTSLDPTVVAAIIEAGIRDVIGDPNVTIIVAPPRPAFPGARPIHYLVTGPPLQQLNLLNRNQVWNTSHGSFVTLPYRPTPTRYIATIRDFTLQNTPEHQQIALETIRRTFINSPQVQQFLYSHRDAIPANIPANQLAQVVGNTLTISAVVMGGSDGYRRTYWNVAIEPPTHIPAHYEEWISVFRSLTFPTAFFGIGRSAQPFRCSHCYSTDHPSGLCPYPNYPGWLGPNPHSNNNSSSSSRGHGRGRGRGRGNGLFRGRGFRGNKQGGHGRKF